MSKRFGFVLFLVLAATLFQPPSVASDSNQLTTICDATVEWISIPLPPGLLELICTITDDSDPMTIQLQTDSSSPSWDTFEYETAQDTNPTEETGAVLTLWLLILSLLLGQG